MKIQFIQDEIFFWLWKIPAFSLVRGSKVYRMQITFGHVLTWVNEQNKNLNKKQNIVSLENIF